MEQVNLWALPFIGLLSGFVAGLLGIGGAVVMLPMLIYLGGVPVLQGTGLNTVQALFASASGVYAHYRRHNISFRLGIIIASTSTLSALVFSILSANIPPTTVKAVYLGVACVAGVLLVIPREESGHELPPFASKSWHAGNGYRIWHFLAAGLVAGTMAGILGVGGAFILVPILISVLRVPTRVAMGTSLFVVLLTSIVTFAGKFGTGQVNLLWAGLVVVGSIVGAQLGAWAHYRVSPRALRLLLAALMLVIIVRVATDLAGVGM